MAGFWRKCAKRALSWADRCGALGSSSSLSYSWRNHCRMKNRVEVYSPIKAAANCSREKATFGGIASWLREGHYVRFDFISSLYNLFSLRLVLISGGKYTRVTVRHASVLDVSSPPIRPLQKAFVVFQGNVSNTHIVYHFFR